jgi:hypothetical protein
VGFETGAGGMTTMGIVWEQHKQALWEDPDYTRFLTENDNLLFVASMLLPVTPWDMGVSLSPWTRVALAMATNDDPNSGYRRNIFTVGPGYTYFDLLPRMAREQATSDMPWSGVADVAQRVLPTTMRLPAVTP